MASAYGNFLHDNDDNDSCIYNYNWLLDMLDNENIMTAKASEVAQKVPTDEEDCIIERCYN